jgi:hypothetical protein
VRQSISARNERLSCYEADNVAFNRGREEKMLSRTVKYLLPAILFVAFCGIFGCGGGDGGGPLRPPVTDITGTWEGEAKDPGVSGNYWYPIEFTFNQQGNKVSGISSLPGLARFSGRIDGNVLTIEGTDIYAYISSTGEEIRGSFTSAGIVGQTAVFNLYRVTDGGIEF